MNLHNRIASNTSATYRIFSKSLYSIIVLAILVTFIIGVVTDLNMPPIPPSPKIQHLIDIHKSMGLTILLLMMVHLIWRLVNPNHKILTYIPLSQNQWVKLIYFLFYFCLFATAIIGWAMSALGGYITYFWGGPNMTLPLPYNYFWHITSSDLHKIFGCAIAVLVFLYAAILIWYRYAGRVREF